MCKTLGLKSPYMILNQATTLGGRRDLKYLHINPASSAYAHPPLFLPCVQDGQVYTCLPHRYAFSAILLRLRFWDSSSLTSTFDRSFSQVILQRLVTSLCALNYCDGWLSYAMKSCHPFIHSFNKHLLTSCCIPGEVYLYSKASGFDFIYLTCRLHGFKSFSLVYRFLSPVLPFNTQIANFYCNELVLPKVDWTAFSNAYR